MTDRTCSVDGCQTRSRKRGWCDKHYQRWRAHGDPTALLPTYEQCTVKDCNLRPRSARNGLCEKHYIRQYRHGDVAHVVDTRSPVAKYRAAHQRIATDRGLARDRRCVDCDGPAEQWSYNHLDPAELTSETGQPYSLDTSMYDPRCRPCHSLFDGTGANQYGTRNVA